MRMLRVFLTTVGLIILLTIAVFATMFALGMFSTPQP